MIMYKFLRILFDPEEGEQAGGGGGGEGGAQEANANEGQEVTESWIKTLPEAAQKDPDMQKYKSMDDFYKSYAEQRKLVGEKGIIKPKDDAGDEEWNKYYNSLGRPEKPEGYQLTVPEDLHESIKMTEDSATTYKEMAHQLGLTQKQADGMNSLLLQAVDSVVKNHEKQQTEAMQATEAALRKEWAGDFDANKALVGKVATQILGAEGIEKLGGAEGLGNNPYFNKLIYSLASKISEDTLKNIPPLSQTNEGNVGEMSESDAKKALEEMNTKGSDFYKALYEQTGPEHDAAVEKQNKIFKTLYK